MSHFANVFKLLQPNHDPRHIEAYIRIEHRTLNGLSDRELRREARTAADCIEVGGIEAAEALAQSYGL